MKINKNINIGDNLIRKLQKILKNLPTGKSAFDLAVENGFEGTMEEWLASLKGQKGEDGQKGDTGARGAEGKQGDSAIVDATDPETPLLVLANSYGENSTKAISQKFFTDEMTVYEAGNVWSDTLINTTGSWQYYIDQETDTWKSVTSSSTNRGKLIDVQNYQGWRVRIEPAAGYTVNEETLHDYEIAFIKEKYPSGGAGSGVVYADECGLVKSDETYDTIVPGDAKYLYVRCLYSGKVSSTPPTAIYMSPSKITFYETFKQYVERILGEYSDDMWNGYGELETIIDNILEQINPEEVNYSGDEYTEAPWSYSWQIYEDSTDPDNVYRRWHSVTSAYTQYTLDVLEYRGMLIQVKADDNYDAIIAFPLEAGSNNQAKRVPAVADSPVTFAEGYTDYDDQIITIPAGETAYIKIPMNANYLYVTRKFSNNIIQPQYISISDSLDGKVSRVDAKVEQAKEDILSIQSSLGTPLVSFDSMTIESKVLGWKIGWPMDANGVFSRYLGHAKSAFDLNISAYRGKKIVIKANPEHNANYAFTRNPPYAYSGSDIEEENTPAMEDHPVANFADGSSLTPIQAGETAIAVIPDNANYLYVDYFKVQQKLLPENVAIIEDIGESVSKFYVKTIHVDAANGSDSNNGLTKNTAVATFSKALSIAGQDAEIMLHGDTTEQFAPAGKHSVKLIGEHGQKNRIIRGTKITSALDSNGFYAMQLPVENFSSGESLNYDDYEDEYGSEPHSEQDTTPEYIYQRNAKYKEHYWLFKHDYADASTEVAEKDKHPIHRGKRYRCGSTKLIRKNTLAELQSETSPAYFYDFTTQTLWTNLEPTEASPIVVPKVADVGVRFSESNFYMMNIEVLYASVELKNSVNVKCVDCADRYACSDGGFKWNSAKDVTLERCEAAATSNGSGAGDGFNAHPGNPSTKDAIVESATLINCWAHDCYDDGFSDHDRSETDIYGGLFEFCGKGGLTPSFGSQVSIHNVESRYNRGSGIYYCGGMSESLGRTGGNAVAFNCYCHDNGNPNFFVTGDNANGHPNRLICVGCKSVNGCLNPSKNQAPYKRGYSASGLNRVVLVNCTDYYDSTVSAALGHAYNAIFPDNGLSAIVTESDT